MAMRSVPTAVPSRLSDLAIGRYRTLFRLPRRCPMWKKEPLGSRRHATWVLVRGADTMRTLMPMDGNCTASRQVRV